MDLRDADHKTLSGLLARHRHGSHCWKQALSRRDVLKSMGGAAGVLIGSRLLAGCGSGDSLSTEEAKLANASAQGMAEPLNPKPIPASLAGAHVNGVTTTDDPSTVTDFNGVVGAAVIAGTGTGFFGAQAVPLFFQVDQRFMQGEYVARDGLVREATFGFV